MSCMYRYQMTSLLRPLENLDRGIEFLSAYVAYIYIYIYICMHYVYVSVNNVSVPIQEFLLSVWAVAARRTDHIEKHRDIKLLK
jgi:hypothetical protein